jgi:proline dehydrogenase
MSEAIRYGKGIQTRGLHPIFDILGESAESKEEAVRGSNAYIALLDEMHRQHMNGSAISLKLTAFALTLDEETCLRAVSRIVKHAHERKIMVWIDMESSPYTSATMRIYRKLLENYDNVGVCIQAYMKRAKKDILSLLPDNPKLRIVKGAYTEKESVAFLNHKKVNQNFKEILTLLSQKDAWTAIGTHDMDIISHALSLPFPNHMEFQMLKGIRGDEKKLLSEAGYTVMEYVPYGKEWDKYVIRRIKERQKNLYLIILSIFGR